MAVTCMTDAAGTKAVTPPLQSWPRQGEPWSTLFRMGEEMRELQSSAGPMRADQETQNEPGCSQRPKNAWSRK